MMASWGPGVGSGHIVAVSPGSGAVLTNARMSPLYPSRRCLPNAREITGCATVGGLGRMPFMVAQLCRTLTCFAMLTCVMLWNTASLPFSPPSASAQVTRWARFELHQQDSDGDLQ